MKKIYEYAHQWIENYVTKEATIIDFTMGNGNDTLCLSKMVPNGKVYAFDIQEEALINTKTRLDKEGIGNYELILDSHENAYQYVTDFQAGIFNLGYLPTGDKTITTKKETTKKAVMRALDLLAVHGMLVIVVYPGHVEGKKESDMLLTFVKTLDSHDYAVARFSIENMKQAPYLLCIEKNRPIVS